jgi:hypothetical protein
MEETELIKRLYLEDRADCVVLKGAMRYGDVESQECSNMDYVKEHGNMKVAAVTGKDVRTIGVNKQ